MKTPLILALLVCAAPAFGTVYTGSVTGDTYIRNDGTPNSNNNGDTANRLLVGSNAATDNLRSLLRFDVSSILNDVTTIGGGNFANLTINSATLQLFERAERTNTVNVRVNAYGFAFDPATATWNAPATGDAVAGGTLGAVLGSQSIAWTTPGTDNDSSTITLTAADLKTHLTNHLSNSIHFLLGTTTSPSNFLSITSDRSPTTARHAKLVIDYTVAPAGGPILTVDGAGPNTNYTFPYSNTAASPVSRTVRFVNSGASGSVTVQNLSVTNTSGAVFSLGTVSPALPATLAVGQTIDIPVLATSAASGTFTGSIFVDTDIPAQDQTLPLAASFYTAGQGFLANSSMTSATTGWIGGSTHTTPGLAGAAADGMARVRGNGDPAQPATRSSHGQDTTVPDNLPDWVLDFRFSPIAPGLYDDYTGQAPGGQFTDRSFQFVVQANNTLPAPGLNDTLDDETILNIAYMPDGIDFGGTPGFYLFNQGTWELIDFNGDGSPLVLAGSTDVDTDANPLNGIGNGNLNAADGDTVNVYRMTVTGSGFGAPGASYSIRLTGPGGLDLTASGLTGFQSRPITTHLPASFAFITTDGSTASNPTGGLCPSFWVDEIAWFAVSRPAKRLVLFNGSPVFRSLNGAPVNQSMVVALNDGTGPVDVSAALAGTSAVTLVSPPSFPVTLASGATLNLNGNFDPTVVVAPNTADAGSLTVTSDDPLLPSALLPFVATKVTDSNLLANGDFETLTSNAPFPAAWTRTGTPVSAASFLPAGGSALVLSPGQLVIQDIVPAGVAPMADFQVDFALQFGNENQAHRIRFEANNGDDLVTLRLTANTVSADLVEVFNAGTWVPALSGLSLNPDTTYHFRMIGTDFGITGRSYTLGISTDGVNYTTSAALTAFHFTPNVGFESVTLECGGTSGSLLRVDNVVVTLPPDNTFANWMGGFTFAPAADTTPGGDADNDGIPNLVENVLGTAPNAPTTGLAATGSTGGALTFQHAVNPDPAADVASSYEWSTDLVEWKSSGQSNTGGVSAVISPSAPVAGVVTVTTSLSAGSTSSLFVRLVAIETSP